ncbi:uncharacterized protein TRAVEDRAFT_51321 [Trametes versicolor FP-101664 SS1]|uniref:uncharacterized protein n=1 Tax=Trametes versicolor (strain FP-101664) TaxID=717944 RepID=UPI0004621F82|nr:uncharacterized protein TRAVEDRAFT_51321 [Trametes versicolor FP-101664 SS1]EIW55193.1 hypothetical protein TRAVEDRAFT_51321 [Trametes versicolor FP-101664 SS1]
MSTLGPTLASQVTPLGDALLNAVKAPLALSNPSLYLTRTGSNALNDIQAGSNPGCDTDGFPAVQGWDAVTGLGMPDFQKLLVVVNGVPEVIETPGTVRACPLVPQVRTLRFG